MQRKPILAIAGGRRITLAIAGRRRISVPIAKRFDASIELVDLVLQRVYVTDHVPILLRFLETWTRAAVWSVDALQRQIAAALAGILAIAFDFASFAFITASTHLLALCKIKSSNKPKHTMQC